MTTDRQFEIDWERPARTGIAEAILCSAKQPGQIEAILAEAVGLGRRLLLTRLDAGKFDALPTALRDLLDFDEVSRTAILGATEPTGRPEPEVAIVAAGTSDLPVALEARRTLAFHGHGAALVADVGVAGLHRLLRRIEELRRFRVLIALAGMEGALFTVLAGLVEAPVIAVPTSVGLGVSAGGQAALTSALSSCAPGVVAVNIDNGFGAACAAIKILRAAPTG